MVFREGLLPSRPSPFFPWTDQAGSALIFTFSFGFTGLKSVFYIMLGLFLGLVFLFIGFAPVPVNLKLQGMIRPSSERAELVCLTAGFIDSIYVKEGEAVDAFQPIVSIINKERATKMDQLLTEIGQCLSDLRDLDLLCKVTGAVSPEQISNPAFKQELLKYGFEVKKLELSLAKSENEFKITKELFMNKIIAPKEYSDKEFEYLHHLAEAETVKRQQMILWQQARQTKGRELNALQSQLKLYQDNETWDMVRAPVSGIVLGTRSIYKGSAVRSGQVLGSVSPEGELIVECYAGADKAGLLEKGHTGRFQVDAYNYKYFGWLEGKIVSIDNDFTVLDNRPAYRIRCSIDQTRLLMKNGFVGNLKKGMTVQAQFTLAERKLWQLLWDKLDDWLNPQSGSQSPAKPR